MEQFFFWHAAYVIEGLISALRSHQLLPRSYPKHVLSLVSARFLIFCGSIGYVSIPEFLLRYCLLVTPRNAMGVMYRLIHLIRLISRKAALLENYLVRENRRRKQSRLSLQPLGPNTHN